MTLGFLPRFRFFISTFSLAFVFVGHAFADEEGTASASASSLIWTIGLAGLGVLALAVIGLTAQFLIQALRASSKAQAEGASHGTKKTGLPSSATLAMWLSGIFGVFAVGTIFIVFLFGIGEIDLSSTLPLSVIILKAGFAGFALLFLYLVFLAVGSIIQVVRGPVVEAPATAPSTVPGVPALEPGITRRSFLSLLGWAWVAFTAASLGAISTCLRFFFPNVTFEPPLKFKAGFPNTYSPGVDERFKDTNRVWIIKNEKGFYALSTICTHLGCTPNWLSAEQKFKCPCHGSGFYATGINFEGPAPRPLERFQITLSDDGQIEVDQSVKFQYELGQWGLPGSFLDYTA